MHRPRVYGLGSMVKRVNQSVSLLAGGKQCQPIAVSRGGGISISKKPIILRPEETDEPDWLKED